MGEGEPGEGENALAEESAILLEKVKQHGFDEHR